jgi:hypothetical protein
MFRNNNYIYILSAPTFRFYLQELTLISYFNSSAFLKLYTLYNMILASKPITGTFVYSLCFLNVYLVEIYLTLRLELIIISVFPDTVFMLCDMGSKYSGYFCQKFYNFYFNFT